MDYSGQGESIMELLFRPDIRPFPHALTYQVSHRGEPLQCPRHWDPAKYMVDLRPSGTCYPSCRTDSAEIATQ